MSSQEEILCAIILYFYFFKTLFRERPIVLRVPRNFFPRIFKDVSRLRALLSRKFFGAFLFSNTYINIYKEMRPETLENTRLCENV